MSNHSAVLFLAAIFAVTHSALLSSEEEEVMTQQLPLREDFLALKQSEANQQGKIRALPWLTYLSPVYDHSLYNSGETPNKQKQFSKGRVWNFLNAGKFVAHDEERKHFIPSVAQIDNSCILHCAASVMQNFLDLFKLGTDYGVTWQFFEHIQD